MNCIRCEKPCEKKEPGCVFLPTGEPIHIVCRDTTTFKNGERVSWRGKPSLIGTVEKAGMQMTSYHPDILSNKRLRRVEEWVTIDWGNEVAVYPASALTRPLKQGSRKAMP